MLKGEEAQEELWEQNQEGEGKGLWGFIERQRERGKGEKQKEKQGIGTRRKRYLLLMWSSCKERHREFSLAVCGLVSQIQVTREVILTPLLVSVA